MSDDREVLEWIDGAAERARESAGGVEGVFDALGGEHAHGEDGGIDEAAAYTRRNLWDMSGAQYNQLRRVLDSLNTATNPVWGRFWFLHRVLGDIVHGHPQRRFLPWHRLMVWKFEQIIRGTTEGANLYVPYWTWWQPAGSGSPPGRKGVPALWADYRPSILVPTLTDPGFATLLVALQTREVRAAFGGLSPTQMRNVLVQALTRNGRRLDGTTIAVTRADRAALRAGTTTTSSRGSVELPSKSEVRRVLRLTSLSSFSDELEDIHGTVHVWAGNTDSPDGVMRSPPWSPCDILFYFHHCEVDRLWRLWQARNGTGPAWSVTGAENPPWTERIADVLDVAAGPLAFDYESLASDDPLR